MSSQGKQPRMLYAIALNEGSSDLDSMGNSDLE
jgi:hypothetical protein